MNKVINTFLMQSAGVFAFVVFLGLTYFFLFDFPYPTSKTADAWEKNFKRDVTSDITDFRGYWLDADIAAYIYGYEFTSLSAEDHKRRLVASLEDFSVITNTDSVLLMRQPVRYSFPDGYNEWRFIFSPGSRHVTVLYANLDSRGEMKFHENLVERAKRFHEESQERPNNSFKGGALKRSP